MAKATRRSAPRDTPRAPRLWVAFVIAFVLHAPLFPTSLFAWMRLLLDPSFDETGELEGEAIIPIDFDFDPNGSPEGAPPDAEEVKPVAEEPAEAPPEAVVVPTAPTVKEKPPEPKDAGVDAPEEAGTEALGLDGGAPFDAGADDLLDAGGLAAEDAGDDAGDDAGLDAGDDAGLDAGAEAGADAGPEGVRDPLEVAGNSQQSLVRHPNVQVYVASDRIRDHELGAQFGRLLTTIPQWKAFFEGSGLDPIRDLDHLLIAGPQFRDTSKVTVVLDYNVGAEKMRAAIERVLAKSDPKGKWLTDTTVPAALGTVQGSPRIFALLSKKRIMYVIPPETKSSLAAAAAAVKPFDKSSKVGIIASTISPAKALRDLKIKIPATLTWLGVRVTPTSDGGADVELDAIDASPEQAMKSAEELYAQIELLRVVSVMGFLKTELFQSIKFEARGDRVHAETHVTNAQIRLVLGMAEGSLMAREGKKSDAGAPLDGGP